MTDAEKYVRATWPNAECFETNVYWPGTGPARKRWIVTRSPFSSRSDGFGLTDIEAWVDAANRLEAKAKETHHAR